MNINAALGFIIAAIIGSSFANAATDTTAPLLLGQGDFVYRYRPDKLVVPAAIKQSWEHVHGITLAPDGRILVTYSTAGTQSDNTRALLQFSSQGNYIGTLGDKHLAIGTPHGLDSQQEAGNYYLYHSNNAGQVSKTDARGKLLWSFNTPPPLPSYQHDWLAWLQQPIIDLAYRWFANNLTLLPTRYMPCNVAFHPSEPLFYLADCYGSSLIHRYSTADGSYQGMSFGGLGDAPGQFNTPHGLVVDPRNGQLLVADRGNSRLQYLSLDGQPLAQVTAPEIQQPCDFDVLGQYLLIPDLAGHLLVLDGDNKVLSRLDVAKVLGHSGVVYPHDAIFLPNHDIILGTWNPGTLTYWQRVDAAVNQPASGNKPQ